MPARALITGATGFVGSHIAEAFVGAGYEVRCGVRKSSDTRWLEDLAVDLVPADLDRVGDLARAVEGVDIIVHAAGLTRARRAGDYHRVNVGGTRRLATAALEAEVRRFVLLSSLAARGPDAPTKNGRDHPVSPYGRSKLEAEECLAAFGERMETVVLRPAAVYGPRDTDLLPLFKMAQSGWLIVPADSGLLQPVYVTEVALAVLAAASRPAGFGPFPVAESARYSWREVTVCLEDALGCAIHTVRLPATAFELAGRAAEWAVKSLGSAPIFDKRRAQDLAVYSWTCDPSGTEDALGWRAAVPLSEGLGRTAKWYREAGWL